LFRIVFVVFGAPAFELLLQAKSILDHATIN
jgi:hypothetical protein